MRILRNENQSKELIRTAFLSLSIFISICNIKEFFILLYNLPQYTTGKKTTGFLYKWTCSFAIVERKLIVRTRCRFASLLLQTFNRNFFRDNYSKERSFFFDYVVIQGIFRHLRLSMNICLCTPVSIKCKHEGSSSRSCLTWSSNEDENLNQN